MLRVLGERRAWVMAALVVSALAVGVWAWAVRHAPARIGATIGDRLGVVANVAEADITSDGVKLRGVDLYGRDGGLVVRVDEVEATMSLVRAVFRGASAVRALSARGVQVEVDLREDGATTSIRALTDRLASRSRSPSASEGDGASGGRVYDVQDVDVRVVDRHGALLTVHEGELRKEGDDIRSNASEVLIGDRVSDHAHIGPSRIGLRRDRGTWRLHRLEIDRGSVRSLLDGELEQPALASRARDAVATVRHQEGPAQGGDTSDPAGASAPSNRLFSRLAPDASVEVSNVRIESRTSVGGRIERIEGFSASVKGAGDGWYYVAVGGETSNEGTLDVDLRLMPAEARAEGNLTLRRISLALLAPFVPEIPLHDPDAGTLSATLELDADSPDRITLEGSLRIRELGVASERIAKEPIEHVNVDLRGRGVWLPETRRLEVENGRVRMGKTRVFVEGALERTREHYLVDLTAKLPPTYCNDVVGAIPADVLGSLTRFQWSGNWSGVLRVALDSRDLEATELTMRVRNLCQFERTPKWVRVERFQEPFRHRAVEPDETVFEMETGPGTTNWVEFPEISPFVVPAVISHEDGGFYDHGGFAPWAIRDALVRNLQEGRYVVGASTISMQLAKNLYLQREKTIARKAQEVILTWWLENALDKDQILELYLNVIEYGPSVYGLRQGALYYFGRAPKELSPAESAFLACMLPSPKRYHVSYERGELTRSMKGRMRRLLEHMAKRQRIGQEALAYGLAELDDFRFHRPGDPPAPLRRLPPLGVEPETLETAELDPFEALFQAP